MRLEKLKDADFQNPQPVMSGVYLLFKEKKLTYIGKSNDVYRRISQHRTNGRQFDYASVVSASEVDAHWIERALITAFQPPENKSLNANRQIEKSFRDDGFSVVKPQPRREAPAILSRAGGREHIRSFFSPSYAPFGIMGMYESAIDTGELPSVSKSTGKRITTFLLRADLEKWVDAALVKAGFSSGIIIKEPIAKSETSD